MKTDEYQAFNDIASGMDKAILALEAKVEALHASKANETISFINGTPEAPADGTIKHKAVLDDFYKNGTKGQDLESFIYQKSLNTGSASAGDTIQDEVSAQLVKAAINNQVLLSEMGSRSVPNGAQLTVPVLLQRPTVAQTQENVNGDATPETQGALFGALVADYAKVYSQPTFTTEVIQDSVLDVVAETRSMVAEEYGFHFMNQVLFGVKDGSADPLQIRGLLKDRIDAHNSYAEALKGEATRSKEFFKVIKTGFNGTLPVTDTAATVDFLVDIQTDLSHEYQANAKWYMAKETFAQLRKLKVGDADNRPLLSADFGGLNTTFNLFNKEIVIVDQMPIMQGANVVCPIIYGDLAEAIEFVMVAGSNHSVVDPYTIKGQVAYYEESRFGSVMKNNDAIKIVLASA